MRTPCQPLIFIVRWAIIGWNEWQQSFLLFYPPPSCSSLRSRLPRNNNRGSAHQHSFMAPHYAKRRAKGAWHFFPVSRRIRKDRLRLPLPAFFFLCSSTMFLDQRHHCLAVVVTRGVEAIPSPFGRHAVSQIARRPASNRSSYIDVEHVSFIVKLSPTSWRFDVSNVLTCHAL